MDRLKSLHTAQSEVTKLRQDMAPPVPLALIRQMLVFLTIDFTEEMNTITKLSFIDPLTALL